MIRVSLYLLVVAFVSVIIFSAFFFHFINCRSNGSTICNSQLLDWHTVQNMTFTVVAIGIHIEVSPMGYPVAGESWMIRVYSTNLSSGVVHFDQLPNCTVVVYLKAQGVDRTYETVTDETGSTEFQYSPEYTDVAFQAFSGNYTSERVVFSTHYVSSQVVDTMTSVSGLASLAIGIPATWALVKRKMRTFLSVLVIVGVVPLLLVFVLAIYCKLFLGTVWGYPESLFGFVTLDLLNYLTILGVILTVLFIVLFLISSILFPKKRIRQQKN